MKIKLLKDLPDYKAGYVFINASPGDSDFNMIININPNKYPDFFQVIDEDEELMEELSLAWDKNTGDSSKFDFVIKYLREKGKLK